MIQEHETAQETRLEKEDTAAFRFLSAERGRMAIEILDKVGLRSKALRLPDELSGGEQQRVAIAHALVNQPPIVLADEPTGNLDSATREAIMQLLHKLNAEGHTVVIVTHNPENIHDVDRCIHLRDGKLFVEKGLAVHSGEMASAQLEKERL